MLVLAQRVAAPAEVKERLRELLAARDQPGEDIGCCLVVSGSACRNGAREDLAAALRRVLSSASV
jgi:hypothetical protein